MEQLSSCYFCGAALDASLDEYPVIPKSLHPDPDDQRTVVLCQGCRRKLGTIVESVVEAMPDESVGGTDDAVPASADPEPTAEDAAPTPDDSSGALGDTAAVTDSSDVTDEQRAESNDAGGVADTADPSTNDEGISTDDEQEESARTSSGAEQTESVDGDPLDAADDDANPDAQADTDESTSEYSASTAAGESSTAEDDEPSLSALEYNKVMRLLQNREFPVDRGEIRTVAVNAYQISESEFDAVIDAAISRGLITEENGQFVEGS